MHRILFCFLCSLGVFPIWGPPLSGENASTEPLIQVGEVKLVYQQVETAAQGLFGPGIRLENLDDEQGQYLYQALIAGHLLGIEGQVRAYDQNLAFKQALGELEIELLLEVFEARVVEAGLEVNQAEIEARYRQWGSGDQRHLAHILVDSPARADSLLVLLEQGEDFAALAQVYSQHPESASRGGSMGFLRRELVLPAIAPAAWDLPVDQVHPQSIKSPMGYHLVKTLARRQQSLEEQTPHLRALIEREKRLRRRWQSLEALRQKYSLQWRPEVGVRLAGRQPLPEDQALYRWEGGEFKAADYLRRAKTPQPVFRDTARLHAASLDLVSQELVRQEALGRGWGELPQVKTPLLHKANELLADSLFVVEGVNAAADPSEQQRFYTQYRQRYRAGPSVDVREILVDSQALADSLHALILQGEEMAALAGRFTQRRGFAPRAGLWENVEPGNPVSAKIYRLASQGAGLLEPQKVPGGYSVIRVEAKREGAILDFSDVRDAVRSDLAQVKMDKFIQDLAVKYADRIHVIPLSELRRSD
jgi:parvulin-like peptidyl-prolyl isomerase